MPHGSYKRRTDEERKYYVNRYNRLYKTRTVNIGAMIDHWKVIKEENCCLHDPDVAKLLIECYYESRGRIVDLNHPPDLSLNGPSAVFENGEPYSLYVKKTFDMESSKTIEKIIEQITNSDGNSQEKSANEAPVLLDQKESKTTDSSASSLHTIMKLESEKDLAVKIETDAPDDKIEEKNDADKEQSCTDLISETEDDNEPLDLSEKTDPKANVHVEDENTMDLDLPSLPSLKMKICTKAVINTRLKEREAKPKSVSKPKKSKPKKRTRSKTTKHRKESTEPSKSRNKESTVPSKSGNKESTEPSKSGNKESTEPSKSGNKEYTEPSKSGNKKSTEPSKSRNIDKKKVTEKSEELIDAPDPDPPRNPWQHIKLEDHTDKYTVEKVESFERRNRGAEVYEIMYVCLLCNQFKSVGREVFEEHLECHINKVLNCSVCGYVGFANSDMIRHRQVCCKVKKGREYVCHLCGAKLISRGEKVDHMGNQHGIPELPCRWCKELFTNRHLRKKHYRSDHKDLCQYCDSCKQGLSKLTKIEFKRHVETCVPGHQCQYCGKLFSRKQGLDSHVTFTHLKVRKHLCTMCPYTATTPEKLKLHVLAHQGIRPYKCDQCTFTCVQPYQLKSHMRTHTGEKPFKCDQCNYAAAWNVQLKDHKKAHLSETAVLCPVCNVVFKNDSVLAMHLKKAQCGGAASTENQALTASRPCYNPGRNVAMSISSESMMSEQVLSPPQVNRAARSVSPDSKLSHHSICAPAVQAMMSPGSEASQHNGVLIARGSMSPESSPSFRSGMQAVETVIGSHMVGIPEHAVPVDSPHIILTNPAHLAQFYHDQAALHYHQQQQQQQQQHHMPYDHQQ